VVALLTILGFALLTGWIMKISHVRKALNFSSEAVYNVWRVAIRLLVPITVLWLLVGHGVMSEQGIAIEVAYALPQQQKIIALRVPAQTTLVSGGALIKHHQLLSKLRLR
jgi:uncharacterized membrane protein YkvI